MIREELVARFDQQGFVVVPDLLPADEVAGFVRHVAGTVHARNAGDPRSLPEKTRYEQSFQQCINIWEDFPAVRPLTFHPAVTAAAAALLGVESVRLWHDEALYKEPGGRGTDAHQDQPYWPIVEPRTVTAWIPLVDVSLEMGAMGYYIPRQPPLRHATLRRHLHRHRLRPGRRPEARGVEPVFAPVGLGDAAFHHGLTIHVAGPNRTDRLRRAHTAIFFADGCTRGRSTSPPSQRRQGRHGHGSADLVDLHPGGPPPAPRATCPTHPPPPDPPIRAWPGWR